MEHVTVSRDLLREPSMGIFAWLDAFPLPALRSLFTPLSLR